MSGWRKCDKHSEEGNPAICGNYAKWNQSGRGRQTLWFHIYVEYKKPNSQKPRIDWGFEGLGAWGVGEMFVKGYKLLVIKWMSSGDVIYSMAKVAKRRDL